MGCRKAIPTLILLVAFLAACSDGSLLLGGLDNGGEVSLTLTTPDALVYAGDDIAITIDREPTYRAADGMPERVRVELLDYDGVLLATQQYNSVEAASSLPDVTIPDLEPGLYRLVAYYEAGEEIVTSKEIPLFLVLGRYRIRGLTSFPASSVPEADSLLSLSLDIPFGSDPYLVWYVDGERAVSGYLSQTGTTLAVAAPNLQGIFPVRVDLYPAWHESADSATLRAPVSFSSEIFVNNEPAVLPTDLGPDHQYFMLYHMRGTLVDSGRRTQLFPTIESNGSRFGNVELDARDGLFGYALDGGSGIAFPGYVLPLYAGEFTPVSIVFRLLPTDPGTQQILMESETEGGRTISVLLSEDGRIGFRSSGDRSAVWSDLPAVVDSSIVGLTISLVPQETELIVHFFSDGIHIGTRSISGRQTAVGGYLADPASEWAMLRGETRLGAGNGGYVGIIDEFGLFFQDADGSPASNDALFFQNVAERFGSDLIFAEDFLNSDGAAWIEQSGSVSLESGELVLGRDASLTLPQFELGGSPVRLDLDTTGGTLWLSVEDGDTRTPSFPLPSGSVSVTFSPSERGGELGIGDDAPVALNVSSEAVRFVLESGGADDRITVDSILMRYLSRQLSER